MKKTSFSFKKDKYKSARGGHSRLLNVCCRKCESVVAVYQKDGPGSLRRLYLDRIFAPAELTDLQALSINNTLVLKCKKCGRSPATDPSIILHVDHIKAWANGGETVLENLQTLCSMCNIGKSDLE